MVKFIKAFVFNFILSFVACKKKDISCTPVSPASEADAMVAYCVANGMKYTIDTNNIYYEIIQQGSGAFPSIDSMVTVAYTGSYLNSTSFTQALETEPTTDYLYNFIEGWRLALPYIQQGGHIKMVIPSSLAYGCTGSDVVPANTPLYFDIYLLKVGR